MKTTMRDRVALLSAPTRSMSGRSSALKPPFSLSSLAAALLACGVALGTTVQQILETSDASLTTYLPGAATAIQAVTPLPIQRGVNLDGSGRAGSGLAWSMFGNPYGDGAGVSGTARLGELSLATGAYAPTDIDWTAPAEGASRWVIGRTYNPVQGSISNGYQGRNWFQSGQPELFLYDADSNPATLGSSDVLYIVYGADRYLEFNRVATSSTGFKGKNGAAGVVEFVHDTIDTYVWTDQVGTKTYFFGGNSNRADWQIWKIVDVTGNTAFVGDSSSASTAITSGYNADGSIMLAFDGEKTYEGRRYTYSYTTIDSVSRLTQVLVETKASGGWDSPSGVKTAARVKYTYYSSSTHGPNGHLESVRIRTRLTDSADALTSGVYSERVKYYRYYGNYSWTDAEYKRGNSGDLMMVLDYEGCRKYDWDQDSKLFDDDSDDVVDSGEYDFLGASDSALLPYSAAFFEYPNGDHKISKAIFNGECGCSGGTNGTYEFTYGTSGYTNTGSYDTAWATRTVITQPDGTYVTQFFDEVGQALSRVISDGAPTGSPNFWITQVVRDSTGCVIEVHSPANNNGYTNSSGSITPHSSVGLITYITRASSDYTGFVDTTSVQEGTGGTAAVVGHNEWTSLDYVAVSAATSVVVLRPLMSESRVYHTAGTSAGSNYYSTTYAFTNQWNGSNTDPLHLAMKDIAITKPAVATGNNGKNETVISKRFLRKDGTTAFAKEPVYSSDSTTQKVTYTAFVNGQVTMTIVDAATDGPDFDVLPHDDMGLAENSDGEDVRTTTTGEYDTQGRQVSTGVPAIGGSTRTTYNYYSRLKDGRLVTIQFPSKVSGPYYKGPSTYTVTNHAGKVEFNCTLAIDLTTGINTALTSMIDESQSDPIDALHSDLKGSSRVNISRPMVNLYTSPGNQLTESRSYIVIAASSGWTGSAGTDYDATTFAYDSMGRKIRTVSPDGTISRPKYDALGRTYEQWIGTDDTGDPSGIVGGSNNMTKVQTMTYDGGAAGKNSHLTTRKTDADGSWGGASDQRVTTYDYDYRGRMLLQTSFLNSTEAPPQVLNKYDNMNRVIAVGTFSAAPSASDDPTSTSTNRLSLNRTFYDEQGHVYKTRRHKVVQSTGALTAALDSDEYIDSLTWYDEEGRVIKTKGEGGISKTFYDRLGRATNRFSIGYDNDSGYSDVTTVTGDKVLEESQTYFDDKTGLALMQVEISRFHDDTSTTGALDTDADLSLIDFPTVIKGRPSITTMFYDELGRVTGTAAYGTNGGTDYDRDSDGTTIPTRAATILVTSNTYNNDGTLLEVQAPSAAGATTGTGVKTRYLYDVAQRRVAEIRNYTGGGTSTEVRDTDLYTRYQFSNGHMIKMWVDMQADDTNGVAPTSFVSADANDQVTIYTYGTTIGTLGSGSPVQSQVARNDLLAKVTYPDSSSGSDVVTYAYNALGERVWQKDQLGCVIETNIDARGRTTHRRVTDLNVGGGSGLNGDILRISTVYDNRGMVDTVTQYNNATVGSGTAQDQVQYSYDDWGNLIEFEQDVDSAIGGSGRDPFNVQYAWTKRTPTYGATVLARSTMTLPMGDTLTYGYGASNSLADGLSRVAKITLGSTDVASYDYLGMGQLAGTTLPEPNVFSDAWDPAGTPDDYVNLDRFGRVLKSCWTNGVAYGTNFYDVDLIYDDLGNILTAKDNVLQIGGNSGGHRFDAAYGMDALSRLVTAEDGVLTGSSITTLKRHEDWNAGSGTQLSQTGNWLRHRLDLNGNGNYTNTDDMNDTGTFNAANEWLTRDLDSTPGTTGDNYTLTHDADGNMTNDGKDYKYIYDAFGRLKQVKNQSNTLVSEYKYNGLGYRIGWHFDYTDNTDVGPIDGTVDAHDLWIYFCFDERWRIVATFRDADAYPREQFVWHAAGARGLGGSSYIDSIVLRDRSDWSLTTSASDTLGERRYYCQNWRADVSVILPSTGCDGSSGPGILEWIKYSAYGVPQAYSMADYDRDGTVSGADSTAFTQDLSNGRMRADVNFDGGLDSADTSLFGSATSEAAGRGKMSCDSVMNRVGYAGYQYDPVVSLWHVRHRVLNSELGRWITRDPLAYREWGTLYQYVNLEEVLEVVDPFGLGCIGVMNSGGGCSIVAPPEDNPGTGRGDLDYIACLNQNNCRSKPEPDKSKCILDCWFSNYPKALLTCCDAWCAKNNNDLTRGGSNICCGQQQVVCICEVRSSAAPKLDPSSFYDQFQHCVLHMELCVKKSMFGNCAGMPDGQEPAPPEGVSPVDWKCDTAGPAKCK